MPEFYGSAAGFKTYWADRGDATAAAMDDDNIEIALLVASEYIDRAFRSQFGGTKVGLRAQVREWPRNGAIDIDGYSIDSDGIPLEVQEAAYEAAMRHIVTPGIFFKDYTPSKYASVSISGAVSVEYALGSAFDFQTQFPQLQAILLPVLTAAGTGGFSSLSGAISR